jgi:ATP-dependent Clp protease protease subunit
MMKNSDLFWASKDSEEEMDNAASESDENLVYRDQNRIYFYSEVKRSKILVLNKLLRKLDKDLVNRANYLDTVTPNIYLHVQSFGGSVFSAFSNIDYIQSSQTPIHSVIEGCAASAATMMSVVAAKRYITPHSYMLIHQLSSGAWGKYEEIKDSMKNCDRLMKMIKDIYLQHTKIPKKKLDQILKHDLWFDAEQCLEYGLVDEII